MSLVFALRWLQGCCALVSEYIILVWVCLCVLGTNTSRPPWLVHCRSCLRQPGSSNTDTRRQLRGIKLPLQATRLELFFHSLIKRNCVKPNFESNVDRLETIIHLKEAILEFAWSPFWARWVSFLCFLSPKTFVYTKCAIENQSKIIAFNEQQSCMQIEKSWQL